MVVFDDRPPGRNPRDAPGRRARRHPKPRRAMPAHAGSHPWHGRPAPGARGKCV